MTPPALAVDIRLQRGGFALEAEFRHEHGVAVVFGPSGSGKSLLLSAIAGLRRLGGGRVAVLGEPVEDVAAGVRTPPSRRGVGLVFQEPLLFPHMSVAGNLRFAAEQAMRAGRSATLSMDEAIERFELAALLPRAPRQLSGGEKNRVALARAILAAPRLLLLDEPFAALDGLRRRAYLRHLLDLSREHGLPMLVVTHEIEDAAALADTLIALASGRVVACGPAREAMASHVFQSMLDPRDVGSAIPPSAFAGEVAERRERAVWLKADRVLLASERPRGLSARNIWEGEVARLTREADGSVLVEVSAPIGGLLARVTPEAASDLDLAPGRPVWSIVKTHLV
ncbi:ATP-binding cassette domain-containing protein [bacterium]|nr:ATP-binding cassette domain-containing protein [bacterium]